MRAFRERGKLCENRLSRRLRRALRRRHPRGFRPSEPLFTARVAPGVGLAESSPEPAGEVHMSFGQQRSAWVAAAIRPAIGRVPAQHWPTLVARRFEREGVSPVRPYARTLSRRVLGY